MSLVACLREGCSDFLRSRIRGVRVSHLELDEIWTFVYKKQKRNLFGDPQTMGDAYCDVWKSFGDQIGSFQEV